jgi:acyl-coenzyme A synthetase/AMP-(fatty) acid ligase
MSSLTLFTSGSTKEPKEVLHHWTTIDNCILRSIKEIGLNKDDIVLDVFPANVIAHYTITAFPARYAGAKLVSSAFDPYTYIKLFNKYRPTYISLIPRHYEILSKIKEWSNLDMSCVRYMVTGSGIVSQEMINDFKYKGVQTVANWYGMTEMPPPVFIGYNSSSFDFTAKSGYTVEFSDEGECVVNGLYTGDIFDIENKIFLHRKINADNSTWKNRV